MNNYSGFSKDLSSRFGKLVFIILAFIAALWAAQQYKPNDGNSPPDSTTHSPPPAAENPPPASELNQKLLNNPLIFTKHALCRMECRQITADEVRKVMYSGLLNNRKSDPYEQPCPTFALEGETGKYQKVLVVFAYCSDVTKVITAYPVGVQDPATCAICK